MKYCALPPDVHIIIYYGAKSKYLFYTFCCGSAPGTGQENGQEIAPESGIKNSGISAWKYRSFISYRSGLSVCFGEAYASSAKYLIVRTIWLV